MAAEDIIALPCFKACSARSLSVSVVSQLGLVIGGPSIVFDWRVILPREMGLTGTTMKVPHPFVVALYPWHIN